MSGANLQHLLAMILYMAAVIGIGVYFAGRANKNAESYFLGGRSLGPWVTAFSAEASDMSGYLLMGLPGLAYWTGLADADAPAPAACRWPAAASARTWARSAWSCRGRGARRCS